MRRAGPRGHPCGHRAGHAGPGPQGERDKTAGEGCIFEVGHHQSAEDLLRRVSGVCIVKLFSSFKMTAVAKMSPV